MRLRMESIGGICFGECGLRARSRKNMANYKEGAHSSPVSKDSRKSATQTQNSSVTTSQISLPS